MQAGCPNVECVARGVVNYLCTDDGTWALQGGVTECTWFHIWARKGRSNRVGFGGRLGHSGGLG